MDVKDEESAIRTMLRAPPSPLTDERATITTDAPKQTAPGAEEVSVITCRAPRVDCEVVVHEEPTCGFWCILTLAFATVSLFLIVGAFCCFPWFALAPFAVTLPNAGLWILVLLTPTFTDFCPIEPRTHRLRCCSSRMCCRDCVDQAGWRLTRGGSSEIGSWNPDRPASNICFFDCCDNADLAACVDEPNGSGTRLHYGPRALRSRRGFWAMVLILVSVLIAFFVGAAIVPQGELAEFSVAADGSTFVGQFVIEWCPRDRCVSMARFGRNGRIGESFVPDNVDCDGRFATMAPFVFSNSSTDSYSGYKMRCGSCFLEWPIASFALNRAGWAYVIPRADTLFDGGGRSSAMYLAVTIIGVCVILFTYGFGRLACSSCESRTRCWKNMFG
jgi:hypothetical protein